MTPEEQVKMHQKAFRCAFDYLQKHFPPGDGDEWWEQAAKDLSDFSVSAGESRLAIELLAGVFSYLESIWKERKETDAETEH